TPDSRWPSDPGFNVPIAERVRRETGIATRAVGMIAGAQQAEEIVASGKADMVAMGRAFLDDPHWTWRAAQMLGGEVARPPQYARSAPKLWPGATLRG
ncbi:MAG TPA: oxidoreductase, partial [Xanthobacteraceae bacterium]|nr:oxidoreductase [Xanthobacteraceae bacterium]